MFRSELAKSIAGGLVTSAAFVMIYSIGSLGEFTIGYILYYALIYLSILYVVYVWSEKISHLLHFDRGDFLMVVSLSIFLPSVLGSIIYGSGIGMIFDGLPVYFSEIPDQVKKLIEREYWNVAHLRFIRGIIGFSLVLSCLLSIIISFLAIRMSNIDSNEKIILQLFVSVLAMVLIIVFGTILNDMKQFGHDIRVFFSSEKLTRFEWFGSGASNSNFECAEYKCDIGPISFVEIVFILLTFLILTWMLIIRYSNARFSNTKEIRIFDGKRSALIISIVIINLVFFALFGRSLGGERGIVAGVGNWYFLIALPIFSFVACLIAVIPSPHKGHGSEA